MNALVVFGFHNTVTRDSIYALTFQHLARTAYEDFVNTTEFIARIKVLRRIYSSNKQEIWSQFVFSTLACLFGYLSPFFQQKLLEYIEIDKNRPSIRIAYLYVFCLFLVGIVKLLCNTVQLWMGRRWNIRTLIMLDSEIFSKTLKRKDVAGKVSKVDDEKEADENNKKDKVKEKKEETKKEEEGSFSNVGKITNLMSVDADKLADIPSYIFVSIYTKKNEEMDKRSMSFLTYFCVYRWFIMLLLKFSLHFSTYITF